MQYTLPILWFGGDSRGRVERLVAEATLKACGVGVAMLPGV